MNDSRVRRLVLACAVLIVSVPGLSACNTIEGIGRDVQAGGEAVSEAAKDVKNEIAD